VNHLTDEQISRRVDGALQGRALAEVEAHLAACAACREALATLVANDEALRPALTHDPGPEYFETFAARVEDRIRAAGLSGAQARERPAAWGSPRRLAWIGGLAALVVGGAAAAAAKAGLFKSLGKFLWVIIGGAAMGGWALFKRFSGRKETPPPSTGQQ